MNRIQEEIEHFGHLEHVWFGQTTAAGQRRYVNKAKGFIDYCRPQANDRILEIGCGDGEFTKLLKPINAKITATDITPSLIERAEKKVTFKGLNYRVENCEKLSFNDGSFSIVCGVSILHHVNVKKTLKEAFRVLKPGGKIFFTEPNLVNPILYVQTNVGWLRRMMEFSPRETPLLRREVEKTLKNIGYSKVVVKNIDFLFPWIPKFMINPLEKLGILLENTPFLKEFSGSLLIFAIK